MPWGQLPHGKPYALNWGVKSQRLPRSTPPQVLQLVKNSPAAFFRAAYKCLRTLRPSAEGTSLQGKRMKLRLYVPHRSEVKRKEETTD